MIRIAFSTLGCPQWELTRIVEQARALGYHGIEFRGIKLQMKLYELPEFSTRLAETRSRFADAGLAVCCLGTSCRFHDTDKKKLAENVDEGKRFMDLAAQLGCPVIRVFGNEVPKGASKKDTLAQIADGLRALGEHGAGRNVTAAIENHGEFLLAKDMKWLVDAVRHPNVGVCWDVGNAKAGGEEPETSVPLLKRAIVHCHVKDAVFDKHEDPQHPGHRKHTYCLLGEGEVKIAKFVELLAKHGYGGFLSLEWEKGWIPELAEPEVAFPHAIRKLHAWIGA
jgi:sugar phosphate isomerase/epimerase